MGRSSGGAAAPSQVGEVIAALIGEKRRVSFIYNGRKRVVEPQCLGLGAKGNELLRGHQISGGVEAEPLFTVAKMSDVVVLDDHFSRPGPNYKKGDSAMKTIFAEL
jgi:hypothetical protein